MIVTVVGARPQFVKAAVLSKHLKDRGVDEFIVHTGQHYDYKMSEVFFSELGLPGAQVNLNSGSGSHGTQTAAILVGVEKILLENASKVSHVLLYGDTNSTLAGALAASKLNIPIIHVEAGLRSFNRAMPEEINRIVTDQLASILFCSSEVGRDNLFGEGITKGVYISGDIMYDAFEIYSRLARQKFDIGSILPQHIKNDFALLTIHRPVNTDNLQNLNGILEAMGRLDTTIVWPIHPRNKKILDKLAVPKNVLTFEPFSYLEMLVVIENAASIITDSGGLQKEAYWAKKPCVTVRSETEWVETLHNGWNTLVRPSSESIVNAMKKPVDTATWRTLYGDANTGSFMADIICESSKQTG